MFSFCFNCLNGHSLPANTVELFSLFAVIYRAPVWMVSAEACDAGVEAGAGFQELILNDAFTDEAKAKGGKTPMFLHHVSQQLLDDHSSMPAMENRVFHV